jgi:serine protease inhibitor
MTLLKPQLVKNLSISLIIIPLNACISPSGSEVINAMVQKTQEASADDVPSTQVVSPKSQVSAQNTTDEMSGGNIAGDINKFAGELYAQLNQKDKTGNLFFSPYSIYSALAMTYAGAAGETAKQMEEALHFPGVKVHSALAQLEPSLTSQPSLQIANALWGQEDLSYKVKFVDFVHEHYAAPLKAVDFEKQTEAARKLINDWTAKQTADRITELFQPGVLTKNTKLVLTNAIYFKGAWHSSFDESQTKDLPFHLSTTEKVTVPTMYQENKFNYLKTEEVSLVELPYQYNREQNHHGLSMVIILPEEIDGLPAVESQLKPELNRWLQQLADKRKTTVQISLPRFKTELAFDLKQTLQAMGMKDAFNHDKADFSGINSEIKLAISTVVHKAFVAVNEEGTEAAAATGVSMTVRSIQPQPVPFKVDHPFIFLIKDNQSGTILFWGKINNPIK